jgi:hypothetical protein
MSSFQNPYNKPTDFQQRRDFSQKISATFDFIRVHFRPLAQCMVYYVLPVPLVGFIAAGVAQKLFFQSFGNSFLEPSRMFGLTPAILMAYIPLILGYTLLILTVYGYLILRLETPASQPVEPPMVGAWIRTRILPTLGGGAALVVLLILATVLLLIPGIWLSVPTALFFFVRLYEKRSIDSAITRCVDLVKNHWWSTLGLLIVISMIRMILPYIIGLAMGLSTLLFGALQWQDGANMFYYVIQAINQLVSLLTYSISLLAIAFQYFNLVEIKEGLGVYALLEQLGKPVGAVEPVNRFGSGYEHEEGEY